MSSLDNELLSGITDSVVSLDERVGELERKENPAVSGVGPFVNEIHVDKAGDGDFTSIKDACDYVAAQSNVGLEQWTIYIHAGEYDEDPFTLPDWTTLLGIGGDVAVGPNLNPLTTSFIATPGFGNTLHNIQITANVAPTSEDVFLIDCSGTSLTLNGCFLSATVSASGANEMGCVRVTSGGSYNFFGCEFSIGNNNAGTQYVLYLDVAPFQRGNYIRSCRLWRTGTGTSRAIYFAGTSAELYVLETTIKPTATDLYADTGATIYLRGTNYSTSGGSGTVTYMYTSGAGSGTVTSVAMTVPSFLSVSGSPITSSGTLAVSLASQSAFTVLARGSGSGTPSFQALAASHIPNLAASKITSGALLANVGGTGFSSYAVGDLLYANTTSTLAKLADVATGNALISGGVGVAPAWGKVDLTAHVSGTLPVPNGGIGLNTIAADNLIYSSALDTFSATPITAFGRSLIDDANAAAARTTLELDAGGAGDIWVLRAGDTMTGNLTISRALSATLSVVSTGAAATLTCTSETANSNFNFNAAGQAQLNWQKWTGGAASARFLALMTSTAETGSNAGSNWQLLRRTDAGASLGQPVLAIERATGFIGVHRAEATATYTLDILGTFRVDATTGGIATLYRTSNISGANQMIGRLTFDNSDSDLSTQNSYGYIEVQSAAAISGDAARGRMLFAVTPNTVASAPVVRLTIEEDGRIHGSALHNNAGAVTGTTNQYMASGTYTPTLNNTTNVAASTAYQCQWIRVGNVVTVSGKVDVDPTAAAATVLGISLPIASNFGAVEDCAGAAFSPAVAGQGAAILGSVANDRAEMQWVAVDTANRAMAFTFTYEVI